MPQRPLATFLHAHALRRRPRAAIALSKGRERQRGALTTTTMTIAMPTTVWPSSQTSATLLRKDCNWSRRSCSTNAPSPTTARTLGGSRRPCVHPPLTLIALIRDSRSRAGDSLPQMDCCRGRHRLRRTLKLVVVATAGEETAHLVIARLADLPCKPWEATLQKRRETDSRGGRV